MTTLSFIGCKGCLVTTSVGPLLRRRRAQFLHITDFITRRLTEGKTSREDVAHGAHTSDFNIAAVQVHIFGPRNGLLWCNI